MAKFRKKPVEVEARELHYSKTNNAVGTFVPLAEEARVRELADWCGGKVVDMADPDNPRSFELAIVIPTLEGDHMARNGDWIIQGVAGEFYPCKSDIFDRTYEAVQ